MRVNEIIQEEKLNEAVPVIAGLTLPVALGYISAAITAYSAIELYQLIKKYSDNPEDMSEDDWGDLFIDIALAAIPGFAKLGKPALLKLVPRSLRNYGGRYIKGKIDKKLAKDQASILKKYGAGAQKGKSPDKQRRMQAMGRVKLARARQRAEQKKAKIKKAPIYDAFVSGLGAGVVGKLVYDYWEKYEILNEQYQAVKSGDLTGFEGMTADQAIAQIVKERDQLVGELALGVGAVIAPLAIAGKLKLFAALYGKILPGGKHVKGAVELPANAIAAFAKTGGVSIAAFLQTESGQKLLENQLVQAITTLSGSFITGGYNFFLDMVDFVGNKVGINTTGVTGAMRPNIQPNVAPPPTGKAAASNELQIMMDPKNNNIKFIDGHQVTGPDGYVLNTIPGVIRDIRRKASALKLDDPFKQLKFDPNKQYTNLQ